MNQILSKWTKFSVHEPDSNVHELYSEVNEPNFQYG